MMVKANGPGGSFLLGLELRIWRRAEIQREETMKMNQVPILHMEICNLMGPQRLGINSSNLCLSKC